MGSIQKHNHKPKHHPLHKSTMNDFTDESEFTRPKVPSCDWLLKSSFYTWPTYETSTCRKDRNYAWKCIHSTTIPADGNQTKTGGSASGPSSSGNKIKSTQSETNVTTAVNFEQAKHVIVVADTHLKNTQ